VRGVAPYLLVAIIVGCGIWLFTYQRSKPQRGESIKHLKPLACTSCGKAYAKEEGDPPVRCHFCGKQTAWVAGKCAGCGKIVPVPTRIGFQGPAEPIKCPHCGKSKFLEVPPNEIERVDKP